MTARRRARTAPTHAPLPTRIRNVAELGTLLRAWRRERGLTQVEAAGLAGVGDRFLRELERGKVTASLGKTLHVLNRFGLEVSVTPRGAVPQRSSSS